MTAVPPPDPNAPQPIDPAEALIVVTGLEPFLRHTSRDLGGAIVRSEQLPDTIETKMYRFINREEREPPADLPPFNFDETVALIDAPYGEPADGHDHDPIERTMRAFGSNHQLALAVGAAVTRIHQYVQQQIPRRTHASLVGVEVLPPSRSELCRFRRCWQIAAEPLSLFDRLNEFAMSRDEVACFASMFPTVQANVWPIVTKSLARKTSMSKGWEPSRQKDVLLRVLGQQEAPSLVLARALQPIYAAEQQAQAARDDQPLAKSAISQADESTATQRLDAGM